MDTTNGYPDAETIAKVLDTASKELSRRTGRSFELTFSTDDRILRSVRDDGYHAAVEVLPYRPLWVRRVAGERIGVADSLSWEERARMAFCLHVDDAVDAIEGGHIEQQAAAKAAALPAVGSFHG